MLVLEILVGIGIILAGCAFLQLNQVSGAITTLNHQLEYLGAPMEICDGRLVAKRRVRNRWVITSATFADGRVVHYVEPDEGRSYEPPE